jgi:hypothetical protein
MPKTEIDYSKTIIYKITCKDTSIKDTYVGHTTNLTQRKHYHKQCCINGVSNSGIYDIIRENGGWTNWLMESIVEHNCSDHNEAKIKEKEYYTLFNENLAIQEKIENKNENKTENFDKKERKVKKNKDIILKPIVPNSSKKMPENAKIYSCEKCDFVTSKQSNYDLHLSTRKHKNSYNSSKKSLQKMPTFFSCVCGKEYKHRQGLYTHKKVCDDSTECEEHNANTCDHANTSKDIIEPQEVKTLTNMVMELMKSNAELQKQLVDVCKNSNNTINTNINSNNKTFNLQFFLNEQCKDAMNISEFVSTFDLQLEDLDCVGKLGYVEGITKLIVDKLNGMDIYKRPMHCSDAKRETIYIKDDNKWEKEERGTPKLRKAIKSISFNNMKLVVKWSDTYPESKNIESRLNDKYIKLVKQSTGGNGDITDNEDKIIKRIAREIIIDKI